MSVLSLELYQGFATTPVEPIVTPGEPSSADCSIRRLGGWTCRPTTDGRCKKKHRAHIMLRGAPHHRHIFQMECLGNYAPSTYRKRNVGIGSLVTGL
jgi:hypothetical protein